MPRNQRNQKMGSEEQGNGKDKDPTRVVASLKIEMKANGDFVVDGPIEDPILFFGLLEMAKTRAVSRMTMMEMAVRARQEAEKPKIEMAHGILPDELKKLRNR